MIAVLVYFTSALDKQTVETQIIGYKYLPKLAKGDVVKKYDISQLQSFAFHFIQKNIPSNSNKWHPFGTKFLNYLYLYSFANCSKLKLYTKTNDVQSTLYKSICKG